jgi:hypothetical protein
MSCRPLALVLPILAAVSLTGCNLEQRYLMPDGGGLYAAAITTATPAYLESEEDGSLYIVESRIEFPVHAPTDMEMAALGTDVVPPFARRPWVVRDDYQVEIDLVVSNLSPDPVQVTVTMNGINEFNEYIPSAQVIDDELVIDFAQWERTYLLEPGARRMVTVREEELDEIAVDLASVVNGEPCSALANQIVYFANQAGIDPRSTACIPGVIPGLVGVRFGVRLTGGTPPPQVAVEAVVRMRDLHDRVATAAEVPWLLPVPAPFTPPVMMEE